MKFSLHKNPNDVKKKQTLKIHFHYNMTELVRSFIVSYITMWE